MKTWKLVSGILSIILAAVVFLETFLVSVVGFAAQQGQFDLITTQNEFAVSTLGGVIVGIFLLSAGIVSIVTRNKGKSGEIASLILYGLAATIGFCTANRAFKDLFVWSAWCLVCAVLYAVCIIWPSVKKKVFLSIMAGLLAMLLIYGFIHFLYLRPMAWGEDTATQSPQDVISSEPYYMEDVHSITVDGVAIIVSDIKIVPEGATGNYEDGPVLMVYYNMINYTDEPVESEEFRIKHLEVLSNYVSGGDIMYLFPAAASDPVYNDDTTIEPGDVAMYADAYEITDDLETVTLRFIADDAATPLGVETYTLSQITQDGTNMD